MRSFLTRLWRDTDGTLSFEWTMLTSLLTIGAVSGVATVRDAVIDEMGDLAQAMVALDQSYTIEAPLVMRVHDTWRWGSGHGYGWNGYGWNGAWDAGTSASASAFIDASSYQDCYRGKMKVIEFPRQGQPAPGAPGAPAPAPTPEEEPAL